MHHPSQKIVIDDETYLIRPYGAAGNRRGYEVREGGLTVAQGRTPELAVESYRRRKETLGRYWQRYLDHAKKMHHNRAYALALRWVDVIDHRTI